MRIKYLINDLPVIDEVIFVQMEVLSYSKQKYCLSFGTANKDQYWLIWDKSSIKEFIDYVLLHGYGSLPFNVLDHDPADEE